MDRRTAIARLASLAALPVLSARAQPDARVDNATDFRDLYDVMAQRYPCFALKGIDWNAVGAALLPRATNDLDDESFGLLCMELVARLEDSHAHLMKGTVDVPTPPIPRWGTGVFCLEDDEGRALVYHVASDDAREIRVGDVVTQVDGRPAGAAIADLGAQVSRYVGFSSPHLRRHDMFRALATRERDVAVRLTVESPDGAARTVAVPARYQGGSPRLPLRHPDISESRDLTSTRLDGDVGWIYVRRIREGLDAALDGAVGALADAKGIIIDVRGNSGGGFDSRTAHMNFMPLGLPADPNRPRYTGGMAVLIDARCISAGEGWASWFMANQRARFFGATTAGASARKIDYTM
ncbi:MAG: hypothetical protein KDA25_11060, partial [Phycisphaerales bacterium]|nr:hypothetical protein [Phycisphaerales bacterium]